MIEATESVELTIVQQVMRDIGSKADAVNIGALAQGRFVAGYMDYEERDPICAVFRLDPDGSTAMLDCGIICSNGPCWSPDGRTFYLADTGVREIWAYDYDWRTGAAANRRSGAVRRRGRPRVE